MSANPFGNVVSLIDSLDHAAAEIGGLHYLGWQNKHLSINSTPGILCYFRPLPELRKVLITQSQLDLDPLVESLWASSAAVVSG